VVPLDCAALASWPDTVTAATFEFGGDHSLVTPEALLSGHSPIFLLTCARRACAASRRFSSYMTTVRRIPTMSR
jgi:hypothetical protein